MKVSIIIPMFNNWHLTHSRLMDIYAHVHEKVQIIVVDDASTENIDGPIDWWLTQKKHQIIYVRSPKNMGFGCSMNTGVQTATTDVVILLSNDVIIKGELVTPILLRLRQNAKLLLGDQLYHEDTGWNNLNINGKMRLFPYLAGYLLACKRQTFVELGGFDDRYEKFDYEDVDLSTTAVYLGYELSAIKLPVIHISGATVRKEYPDRERYTRINQERFVEKWSKLLK